VATAREAEGPKGTGGRAGNEHGLKSDLLQISVDAPAPGTTNHHFHSLLCSAPSSQPVLVLPPHDDARAGRGGDGRPSLNGATVEVAIHPRPDSLHRRGAGTCRRPSLSRPCRSRNVPSAPVPAPFPFRFGCRRAGNCSCSGAACRCRC
jgi:hypothetical protein